MTCVLLLCLAGVLSALADEGSPPASPYASPAFGKWKDLPAGTYTIHHQISRLGPNGEKKETFEKDVLLGAGKEGQAVFQRFSSESASGPWKESFGHADVPPQEQKEIVRVLPDETVSIAGRTVPCSVEEATRRDDWGTTVQTSWTDKKSGIIIRFDQRFDGQDNDGRPKTRTKNLRVSGWEKRQVAGREFECYVQEGEETGSPFAGSRRALLHPAVPGHNVRTVTHAPGATEPQYFSELVDFGQDDTQLAELRAKSHYFREERKPSEDLEAKRKIDEMDEEMLASLTSNEASRIGFGAHTAEMRKDGLSPTVRKAVIAALLKALEHPEASARRVAAKALGQMGEKDLTARLTVLLANDPDGASFYLDAIGRQGDAAALATILKWLDENASSDTQGGLSALQYFKLPEARLAAEQRLLDRRPISTSASESPEVAARIVQEQSSLNRNAAAKTLSSIADPSSLPVLVKALDDPSPLVVMAVIPVVAKLGDDKTVPALAALLKSPDPRTRMAVAAQIGNMRLSEPHAAGQLLLSSLDDPAVEVRAAAISAMAGLRVKAAVPKLLEIARQPSGAEQPGSWFPPRLFAVAALGAIGDPSAVPGLASLLDTPDLSGQVVEALVKIDDPSAAKALYDHWMKSLSAPAKERHVSGKLLEALGKVGTRQTRQDLAAYLENCPPPQKAPIRKVIAEIDARLGP